MIRLTLFFLVLSLAAVSDIRKRMIPDWMPLLIAGVSLLPPEPVYLTGLLVALPLLIAGITVGGIGGGDIKLDGIGILAGVINGVGVALQILLPKYFAKDYERDTLLVYGFLGAAVVLMFGMDFGAVSSHMSSTPTGVLLWNLFGIGILCTMVANVSCVKSTQYVEATTTSILSALEVVVGTLVGFVVFHEHMTMLQILGAVIIVVGAIGSEIYQPKRVEKDYGRVK